MEVNGQPHAPAAVLPEENTRYLLSRMFGGQHNRSGRFGGDANISPLPGFESRIVQSVVQPLRHLLAKPDITFQKLHFIAASAQSRNLEPWLSCSHVAV